MADYYGIMYIPYSISNVADETEANEILHKALDELGKPALDRFDWDDVDWSMHQVEEEEE